MSDNCNGHRVAVLGATGSIGRATLDVIAQHPEQFRVALLASGSRVDALLAACQAHRPDHAVIADPAQYAALREGLQQAQLPTQAHAGSAALTALVASDICQTVVAGIVGAAGLASAFAAVTAGKRLLLANKESLVMSGSLLMQTAQQHGAQIIPIDSEHSAIFQCVHGLPLQGVRRLILTASGGPFRGWRREQLRSVTPAQAVKHPTWPMGQKISVDSASLMNKGLEIIEAHYLFAMPEAHIAVVIHPQCLVHSCVEFIDGSTIAQMGLPDMRSALAVGLGWPQRLTSGVSGLDLLAHPTLSFEPPDEGAFPCLRLARQALVDGGSRPAVLNAANEIAVSAFLQGRISFLRIPALIDHALATIPRYDADSLDAIIAIDRQTRQHVLAALNARDFS